tara:strand:- start:104 stop:250 length:147 start_codon:yes stop_codon:yes gene_type:complete
MEKKIFEFIEMMVQDVGVNLYGVRPYIQEQFGLSKKESGEVLIKYMRQ